jgi:uncharacterized membrane protein
MAAEFIVVLAAVGVAYGLYRLRRETAVSLFTTVRDARAVLSAVVGLIVALVLIGSGYLPYMFIGAVLIGYAVLYILVEDPLERVLGVLG